MSTNQKATISETREKLEPELGRLLVHDKQNDLLGVAIPASDEPVVLRAYGCGRIGVVLGVGSLIAKNVDWSVEGITMFCLRESSSLVFGNIELCDDGLAIDHIVFGNASGEQLTRLIFTIAHAAVHIRNDLERMGALTMPPDEETGVA